MRFNSRAPISFWKQDVSALIAAVIYVALTFFVMQTSLPSRNGMLACGVPNAADCELMKTMLPK
jgi:hypothetical protein